MCTIEHTAQNILIAISLKNLYNIPNKFKNCSRISVNHIIQEILLLTKSHTVGDDLIFFGWVIFVRACTQKEIPRNWDESFSEMFTIFNLNTSFITSWTAGSFQIDIRMYLVLTT